MENTENATVHGVFRTLDSATLAREKDFGSSRLRVDDADQWTLAEYNGDYPVATITRFEGEIRKRGGVYWIRSAMADASKKSRQRGRKSPEAARR